MNQPSRIATAINAAEARVADLNSSRVAEPSTGEIGEDIVNLTQAVVDLCTALRMLEERTTVDTITVTGSGTGISLG